MEVRPRVAVVGAGIGGLALAAVLTASGTRCEVFEQAERTAQGGAGVQLAPNAVRPLRRLGLGPVLRAAAVRVEATEIRGADGGPVARMPLGAACERLFGAPYYTVHRAELHAALLDRVPADRVHHGMRLVRLEENDAGVALHFEDGTTHHADVVVGADGVRSVVRAAVTRQTGDADTPRFSGLTVRHGLLPVERLPRTVAREPMVRYWLGPGSHLVCFPVSGGSQVGFTATVRSQDGTPESWAADDHPGELVREFGQWRGLPSQIASAARAAGAVRSWGLHRRGPLARWSTPRVTLLGDAAHPSLLFTSQGVSQTVEDAFDLAARLAGVHRNEVPAALAGYESLRAPRIAAVEEMIEDEVFLRTPQDARQDEREAALKRGFTLQNRAPLFTHDAGRRPEQPAPDTSVGGRGLAGVG